MRHIHWLRGAAIAATIAGAAADPASAGCNKTIAISELQQMNFGTIGVGTGGGTVTLSPSGGVSGPAGFFFTGATAAGQFKASGTNGCLVTITISGGPLFGPGTAMSLGGFTTNVPNPQFDPAGGQLTFNVGASLQVSPTQAGGDYSGTYTVTVLYQ